MIHGSCRQELREGGRKGGRKVATATEGGRERLLRQQREGEG